MTSLSLPSQHPSLYYVFFQSHVALAQHMTEVLVQFTIRFSRAEIYLFTTFNSFLNDHLVQSKGC